MTLLEQQFRASIALEALRALSPEMQRAVLRELQVPHGGESGAVQRDRANGRGKQTGDRPARNS